MNDKDLVIKVFDYFFTKANIISLEICFYTNYDLCIYVKTTRFDDYLFTNSLTCNDDVCKLKIFNRNRYFFYLKSLKNLRST